MKTKPTTSDSSWTWNNSFLTKKTNTKKPLFPVAEFLEKARESVIGPGAGAGIGCGIGLGVGVTGGYGFGGDQWNQLNLAVGIGFGCGVGLGIGYGQGFGYGYSFESIDAYLSEQSPSLKN